MLNTPFGKISMYLNEEEIYYKYEKLENIYIGYLRLLVFEVDDRYKISVNINDLKVPLSFECQFDTKVVFSDSGINSGERLALKTWEKNNLMFSIGTEDEIDGIEIKYLDCGIKVDITKNDAVNELVFGIAWRYIKDYEKEYTYTWFAADPTYAM
jgi:hypothetical protein